MKLEFNVEKKHLVYFGVFLVVLFGGLFVYADYSVPIDESPNPGHSASKVGSGVLDGDLHIDGEFAVVSDDHDIIDRDHDDYDIGAVVAVIVDPLIPGYLRLETTGGADCDDDDPLVNPVGTWTADPELHNGGDTNCDGYVELMSNVVYTQCGAFDDPERCDDNEGWLDSGVPSCGMEGVWVETHCTWNVHCMAQGQDEYSDIVQQCK